MKALSEFASRSAHPMKGRKVDRIDRWCTVHGAGDGPSLDQIRKKVSQGLSKLYEGAVKSGKDAAVSPAGPQIKELLPHKVVFEHDGKLMARRYECKPGKAATFDEPYEVEPHYKPVGKDA